MSTARIMFVCSGNICRSPIAAAWARKFAEERGLPIVVISAGTLGIVGYPAARLGRTAMEEAGVDLSDHFSQGISRGLLDLADWVVVMAPNHEEHIVANYPEAQHKLVRMWAYASTPLQAIADPVGRDLAAFRECRDLLEECVDRWLSEVFVPGSSPT